MMHICLEVIDEINTMVEDKEQCNKTNPHQHSALKTSEAKMIFPYNNEKVEKLGKGLHRSDSGSDFRVLDVHVINKVSNVKNKESRRSRSVLTQTNLKHVIIKPLAG